MLVMNDVVSDARVQRTARSAAAAGHAVYVIGLRSDRAPAAVEARDGYTIVRLDERGPLPDRAAIEDALLTRTTPAGSSAPHAASPSHTADSPSAAADLPSAAAGLPSSAAGLPFPAADLPSAAAGLPFPAADLPSGAADLPSAAAGLPSAAADLPSAAAGLPSAAAGLPSAGATSASPSPVSPSPPAAPPAPSPWRRFQALYDERVTFAIRRNRVYQVLNTYDKRMRRAVKRATSRAAGDVPALLLPFERLLGEVSRWEASSRHMADHDAIRRDVFGLGRRMAELAVQLEADVCHCNDLDTLAGGCWARALRPMRVIYDAHELWTEQHSPAASRQHHTEAYFDFFERLLTALVPHLDAVVTVNPSIGMVLQSRTGCPTPRVVWNCPAWQTADPWHGALRARAAGRKIVLLHGGLIEMDRGLDELVAAAPRFHDTLLVMRGSGNARAGLEQQVRERGLEDRVCFVDPVPLADVIKSAAEADVGIIPYKPTSINNLLSSPNKLFEYMMAGLALAVSDLPELRRVVEAEDIGVTFNPCVPDDIARAVNKLIDHPERLARCRENARRAARERYNWEVVSRELLALYAGG